jgi:hypothetical protein
MFEESAKLLVWVISVVLQIDRVAPQCNAVEKAHGTDGDIDARGRLIALSPF